MSLPRVGSSALLTVLIGGGLAAIAFGAQGGLQLGRTTVVEMAVTLASALLAAAALVVAPLRSRFWGGVSFASLAALAAVTAISIAWSIDPSTSWLEANRTLSYVAAFAAGLALVRLAPSHWPSLLGGVVLACFVVCGYGLLTKVFPGALSPDEFYARLREPFSYWNAAGLMGALGVPACLWLGSRRSGHAALNALAFPVLGLLLVEIMLSYSRGALVAAGIGAVVWFALVPLRLRGLAVLVVSAVPAALVTAWAFSRDALSEDNVIVAQRADAGHELGVLIVLMLVVLTAAGLLVGFAEARWPLEDRARRRAGIVALVFVALLPVAALVGLALSDRGIGGNVSKTWRQFTDPDADIPKNDPGRLTAVGSVRARYWSEGLEMWELEKLTGLGAGAYATARPRFRQDTGVVRHAHGQWNQTLADLGLIGAGVSLAALLAWLLATGRAVSLGPRRGRTPGVAATDPERIGLITIAATALVFGVHSLVDWTWFVPATAMLGLLCAGWVAGRGPALQPALEPPRGRARTIRLACAAGVVVVALTVAWAMWQPLRSFNAGEDALAAVENGNFAKARELARTSHDRNPLSVDPYFDLAVVEEASGRPIQARRALGKAVRLQPANAESWRRLARFELRAGRPRAAFQAARAALFLDPRSLQTRGLFLRTVRALAAPATPPAPAPAPAPAPPAPSPPEREPAPTP